ncbi:MAG: transcriptional repressor LexA [Candidatus Staskawiczbacteria bacterium]|nr:transcriptional repressor LexA [Candidatus Staskawiczbacteria bacterium]
MNNLTPRQKQILDFVTKYSNKKGYAPSYKEIGKYFKLSSTATISQHLKTLADKGHLKKEKHQKRNIEIINKEKLVIVPLVGTITAGEPIETYQIPDSVTVSKNLIANSGDHFALKVNGNSMIGEGIFDGDTVIVRKQDSARNGDSVVALINGNETTLKKIYKEQNGFRLQPANPELKPIFVKQLEIQGRVISVIRNFETLTNKINCGDVLETIKKIPDNSVHLAITSPPYNVGKSYDSHNDKMEYSDYLDWLYKVWQETKRVLVSGGRFAINIAPTGIKDFVPIHHDFIAQLIKLGMKFRTEIVWYKQTMLKRTAWGSFKSPANPHIVPSWEYVLIFSKDQDRLDGDSKMADITKDEFMKFSDGFWQIWPETQRKGHPAPFPEDLIYRLVKFYSYKDSTVLDMFGGTGTVATVAAKTGRNFIHIDVSPQYCKIARDRLEKEINQGKLV